MISIIFFLLSLEETDKDKMGEYFEMAYKYAFKEFSAAMRYIYAKSLQSVIIKLSDDKKAKIKKGI